MAGSVNKATLIGNLARDPEIRSLNSGERVANMTVVTNETWKDKSGERKERAEFHRVTIFNDGLVKIAESYLRKGSKVYVEGQLQTRKYTDQSGVEKFSTEIVLQKFRGELTLLDGKPDGEREAVQAQNQSRGGGGGREEFSADLDDEVPFVSRWGLR